MHWDVTVYSKRWLLALLSFKLFISRLYMYKLLYVSTAVRINPKPEFPFPAKSVYFKVHLTSNLPIRD